MKLFLIAFYKGLLLLLLSSCLSASSNAEFIQDILPPSFEKPFAISFSHGEFDESLDVLNYADKLTGSKPKSAELSSLFLSYKFNNSLKLTSQITETSAQVERQTIPKSLTTDTDSSFFSLSYQLFSNSKNIYEMEFFFEEENQDPLTVDCYEFGSLIVGGSCPEARISFLDAEIYKTTGELVHLPVLVFEGNTEAYGLIFRIKGLSINNFNINHSISYKRSEITAEFTSAILNTTDPTLRGVKIGGQTTGEMLDQFKNELPQTTPWTENIFKYSLNSTLGLTKRTALVSRIGFIKVSRSDYQENPSKEDYETNYLLDIGLFYSITDRFTLYSRASLTSNYLVGINSLSYNRRSNHLFDHPYGQLYIGTLIQF
ncbi:uncharacterized protein METZ01_LOCUS53265 [marine metagenome]|uniref:Uncharacterized protein n=1 Tax=marine metagenome TaxID=408172 RepID=A0A381SAU1_9ZZZZ